MTAAWLPAGRSACRPSPISPDPRRARLADASAQLTLSGLIDNAGIIAAGGPLGLVAQSLENRSDAVILSEAAATLTLTQDATNHGLVLADGALTLAARDIDNTTDAVLYGADSGDHDDGCSGQCRYAFSARAWPR